MLFASSRVLVYCLLCSVAVSRERVRKREREKENERGGFLLFARAHSRQQNSLVPVYTYCTNYTHTTVNATRTRFSSVVHDFRRKIQRFFSQFIFQLKFNLSCVWRAHTHLCLYIFPTLQGSCKVPILSLEFILNIVKR